jgi:hypothetical protein
MNNPLLGICILLLVVSPGTFAQKTKPIPACKQSTFAAFKPLPKMEYDCPEDLNEDDDKILKLPERIAAIRRVMNALRSFADAAWWEANVDDLNACEVHGKPGELSDEEKEKWRQGDYSFSLLGNHQMRLVLRPDPCYSKHYNGSNAFLLYLKGGRVFVTQVLNGYYSRIDDSIGIAFAQLNGRKIIEVSTGNNMPPSFIYHYFAIDNRTNKAVPMNLFKSGRKPTNEIWSAMLLAEPRDLGLPKSAGELKIIRGHRLAPSFSAYEEDEHGRIGDSGRRLRRIVYRWNGRFYAPAR